MRRALTWLVTLPFAVASVLLGHALAYRAVGLPGGELHGYLEHAPQVALVLTTVALLGLAADARSRTQSAALPASLAVVAFVLQEHLERFLHDGEIPFLLASPVLWIGIALQLPLALVIWAVARRAADEIAGPLRGAAPRVSGLELALAAGGARPTDRTRRTCNVPGARPTLSFLTSFSPRPILGQRSTTSGGRMKNALIVAIALVAVAVAVPIAARAQPAAVKPVVIPITAVNGRPVGGIKRPSVKKGQTVRLVIRSNVGTEVHLHGYDIEKAVRKGFPTIMQFVARVPGRFALELHPTHTVLAQLTVRP